MRKNRRLPKSVLAIVQMLDAEGFTPATAHQVERYWRHSVMRERIPGKIERLEAAFSEFAMTLTEGQRLVMGKFIGLKTKEGFDTGLRIGLASRIQVVELDDTEETRPC